MRYVRESDQREAIRVEHADPRNQHRWANFVIRRGRPVTRPSSPIRSSFNAEKRKFKGPSKWRAYEIRTAPGTKATNYEKGVE